MKKINTANDLAINGASPAFAESVHVGRPNMGSREAFSEYMEDIFERRWLTNDGPLVKEFETKIADYHNVKHCVAMCNGTVSLEIAIRALGLKGEVIIPSFTFIATAHALHWQAITPVFADIDPVTHTLDPDAVRKMITPNTTGIIGVHLWGRAANTQALQEISNEYDLKLMFDAAHAFGCSSKGKMIGNFGACEVLSFHATKFFNTFEGGAVLTNDDQLAETMRLMRNFGFSGIDKVIYPGTNGKMTEIAAAMGLVNLESTKEFIKSNQGNYLLYKSELSNLPGIKLLSYDESECNNYQYVVLEITKECPVTRDEAIDALHAENILARRYFWPGCHNMMPYKELFPNTSLLLPNTEQIAEQVVVLPTGATLSEEDVKIVTSVLKTLVESKGCNSD